MVTKKEHKYCGYFRLSKEDTAISSNAFQHHRQKLLDYGIPEDDIYFDLKSGERSDRVNFQLVLAKCRSGNYTHLVIANIARLTRQVLDWELILKDQEQGKYEIISLEKNYDLDDPDGRFMSRMESLFAQKELETTKDRQRKAAKSKRSRGEVNRLPIGYINKNKKIIIDREPIICLLANKKLYSWHDIVTLVIQKYIDENKSYYDICREINKLFGVQKLNSNIKIDIRKRPVEFDSSIKRRPIFFTKYQVKTIFNNQVYRGHLVYFKGTAKEQIIYNNHEAIITPEIAEKLDPKLKTRRRLGGYGKKTKYPLSLFVTCEHCGHKASISKKGGKTNLKYMGYYCRYTKQGLCDNTARYRYIELEAALIEAICTKRKELASLALSGLTEVEVPEKSPELLAKEKELADYQAMYLRHNNPAIKQAIEALLIEIQGFEIETEKNTLNQENAINWLLENPAFEDPEFYHQLSESQKIALYPRFVDKVLISQVEHSIHLAFQ